MKDMLSFLIARDTMHQEQWLAVLEELGGPTSIHPIPNSFPQEEEKSEFSYAFMSTDIDKPADPKTRWTSGPSIDGKGTFSFVHAEPHGHEPIWDELKSKFKQFRTLAATPCRARQISLFCCH